MPGPFYFAWAGGPVQEQVTLITNGNTHGGQPAIGTTVGDTKLLQVVNLASTSNLEEGAFYRIEGATIHSDTYFVYDSGILSGAPGSLNLTSPASTANSVQLKITSAAIVGDAVGTFSAGSNVVAFGGGIDLPAGVYGIRGTGIAAVFLTETHTGQTTGSTTQLVTTGSAFFEYDGASGSAHMQYMVANPTIDQPIGTDVTTTSYTVAKQPAFATASGQFPVVITGIPDGNWYSITSMPDGVLSSLTTGLVYNITGNGLQTGTTFIAPSGGNEITIDQPATSAQLNAILTITGPRTPDTAFDPAVHDRFDADILDIDISHEEGSFATLSVRMRLTNPNIGLLALGRQLWCWLSWDQAWTPGGSATPDLVPLFNGRLVGVPKLQANEIVQLEFLARPDDFGAQKLALSQALSVLPYYDPVWLAANVNIDTVLETYSALWHIDRTTLGVTISDLLQGEDGTVIVEEQTSLYENFTLSYGQPPLVAVTVTGTVTWQQQSGGYLDVTQKIVDAFAAQNSPWHDSFPKPEGDTGPGGGGLISFLSGDAMQQNWPQPGTAIGGGWSLSTLNDGSGYPLCYIWNAVWPIGWLKSKTYNVTVSAQMPTTQTNADGTQNDATMLTAQYSTYIYGFPLSIYKVRMVLRWEADRKRTETITAVMTADVQRLLSDSAENDRESVELTSEYVGQGVDPGGEVPIGTLAYRSYFQTDRGTASFEYLLLAARAKLRARARAVDITFAMPWNASLGVGLRHSVTLFDRRLPGGAATGKVKSYKLSVTEGRMLGEFTIGCSIGNGVASTAVSGVNAYVDDGYVDLGYQVVVGGQRMLLTDELAYQSLEEFAVDDDGLDLTRALTIRGAVNFCTVINGLLDQLQGLGPYQQTVGSSGPGDPSSVIRQLSTQVTLDMKPVQGAEFHTSFFPAVSALALPRTIDLDAADDEMMAEWDRGVGGSTWDDGSTVWDQPSA
jgi:hypothetical protein